MPREPQSSYPPDTKVAARVASELAARQFGVVATSQLVGAGVPHSQIRAWRRGGRLHSRYRGVHAWGRADLPEAGELAAAILLAGPDSGLGSLTALWWLGLLRRRPTPINVASPRRIRSQPGVEVSQLSNLQCRHHRGLPVVPLAQALLAATRKLPRDSLRLVLARAEFARLLDWAELEAVLRSGRRGTRPLQAAADAHLPQLARCANGFERAFVLLCERFGLPLPVPNPRIGRYRPDMLWREVRLIVELDGRAAHSTTAQLAADRRRQVELERLGFTVVRFDWDDVHERPELVATKLRDLLGPG